MCNFTGHKELERILRACIIAKIDKAFVNNFGASFSGDVAAKINVQFTGNFEIIGGPGITHGVVKCDSTAARNSNQRIRFSSPARGLHWLEMHAGECADDFEMTEF